MNELRLPPDIEAGKAVIADKELLLQKFKAIIPLRTLLWFLILCYLNLL